MAGDKTDWHCPVCKPKKRLVSRRLGTYQIAVLECQRCAGLWLGLEPLQAMLSAEARGEHRHIDAPRGTSTEARNQARGYRPCVVCGELMTRRNMARGKSGVVADLCGHHGVWFDADELSELIAWTRTGGLEDLRRDIAQMIGAKDGRRRRQAADDDRSPPPGKIPRAKTSQNWDDDEDPQWLTVLGLIATKLLTRR